MHLWYKYVGEILQPYWDWLHCKTSKTVHSHRRSDFRGWSLLQMFPYRVSTWQAWRTGIPTILQEQIAMAETLALDLLGVVFREEVLKQQDQVDLSSQPLSCCSHESGDQLVKRHSDHRNRYFCIISMLPFFSFPSRQFINMTKSHKETLNDFCKVSRETEKGKYRGGEGWKTESRKMNLLCFKLMNISKDKN